MKKTEQIPVSFMSFAHDLWSAYVLYLVKIRL